MNFLKATIALALTAFGAAEDVLENPSQNANILSRIDLLEHTVLNHSIELDEIRADVLEARSRRASTSCISEKVVKGKTILSISCVTEFNKKDVLVNRANLFVYNGESGDTLNGKGNIIMGARKTDKKVNTGVHNIVIGSKNKFTSYGGFVTGVDNKISAPYATVTGGRENNASGPYSSVAGGRGNVASGEDSVASGGEDNIAEGVESSVTGGKDNTASGLDSAVGGGRENEASGNYAAVNGGFYNDASGYYAAVNGGFYNDATKYYATVNGGQYNVASGDSSVVSGGEGNVAAGKSSTVIGGQGNTAEGDHDVSGDN